MACAADVIVLGDRHGLRCINPEFVAEMPNSGLRIPASVLVPQQPASEPWTEPARDARLWVAAQRRFGPRIHAELAEVLGRTAAMVQSSLATGAFKGLADAERRARVVATNLVPLGPGCNASVLFPDELRALGLPVENIEARPHERDSVDAVRTHSTPFPSQTVSGPRSSRRPGGVLVHSEVIATMWGAPDAITSGPDGRVTAVRLSSAASVGLQPCEYRRDWLCTTDDGHLDELRSYSPCKSG